MISLIGSGIGPGSLPSSFRFPPKPHFASRNRSFPGRTVIVWPASGSVVPKLVPEPGVDLELRDGFRDYQSMGDLDPWVRGNPGETRGLGSNGTKSHRNV